MKKIVYTRRAIKQLKAAPAKIAEKIESKLALYAKNPAALAPNIKAMQGVKYKGCLRLRVGDWRVIFSEDGEVLEVQRIAARGDIYRDA